MKRCLLIKPNDPDVEFAYFDSNKTLENKFKITYIKGKFRIGIIKNIELILDSKLEAEKEFQKLRNKLYLLDFNDISEQTLNSYDAIQFIENHELGLIVNQSGYNFFTIRFLETKKISIPIFFDYDNSSISEKTKDLFNGFLEREEIISSIVDSNLLNEMEKIFPDIFEKNKVYSSNLEFIKIYSDDLIDYCGEIGFGFNSEIDAEHGFGIIIKNWEIYSSCQRNDL